MEGKFIKRMIILEASNTYFGGGFVLLEQILSYCENKAIPVKAYIGYAKVYHELLRRNYKYIELKKTTTIKTIFRYLQNRTNVLFFCNLPPFVRNSNSVLYAHNILFFKTPSIDKDQSFLFTFKKYIYYAWIKHFSRNVSVIACQTEDVKDSLSKYLNVSAGLFPFYKTLKPEKTNKEYDFCYVSSASPHKNHSKLFQAVDSLSDQYSFKLAVTIAKTPANKELIAQIDAINKRHNRKIILNQGSITEKEVVLLYCKSRALIFPSLQETIALPLIEAIQCGLTVLSSDRPYSYQVLDNPITFDPLNVESIKQTMEDNLAGKHKGINQNIKVENKLSELIELLQS